MVSGEKRSVWTVAAPVGGWGPPWPQAAEIAQVVPSEQWTLIGGLMVQLHAVRAGLPLTRATVDVDMVLHIETGAATFGGVRGRLEQLGYELQMPVRGRVHRFVRSGGVEQVDVMVADHLAPKLRPRVSGREVFAVPAGTSALRKTVDCLVEIGGVSTKLSVPDVLGALVLKGAAYLEDPRDRGRHLDDAVVLACAVDNPMADRARMRGSDRGRVRALAEVLADPDHRSWLSMPEQRRRRGRDALLLLVQEPRTRVPQQQRNTR
ncbi:hypothetical protein [Rhodococcus koreensis]|uniref:hypothetical protein n=1 Tax=Rhodococcus koreensis TaxID=99653 RepID=UPI00366B4086